MRKLENKICFWSVAGQRKEAGCFKMQPERKESRTRGGP